MAATATIDSTSIPAPQAKAFPRDQLIREREQLLEAEKANEPLVREIEERRKQERLAQEKRRADELQALARQRSLADERKKLEDQLRANPTRPVREALAKLTATIEASEKARQLLYRDRPVVYLTGHPSEKTDPVIQAAVRKKEEWESQDRSSLQRIRKLEAAKSRIAAEVIFSKTADSDCAALMAEVEDLL